MVDAYAMIKAGVFGFITPACYFGGKGLKELGEGFKDYSARIPDDRKKGFRSGVRRAKKRAAEGIGNVLGYAGDGVAYLAPVALAVDGIFNPFGNPAEKDFGKIRLNMNENTAFNTGAYAVTAVINLLHGVNSDKVKEEKKLFPEEKKSEADQILEPHLRNSANGVTSTSETTAG